jgi:hypothetical protein
MEAAGALQASMSGRRGRAFQTSVRRSKPPVRQPAAAAAAAKTTLTAWVEKKSFGRDKQQILLGQKPGGPPRASRKVFQAAAPLGKKKTSAQSSGRAGRSWQSARVLLFFVHWRPRGKRASLLDRSHPGHTRDPNDVDDDDQADEECGKQGCA